jgi:hypothetical protein
VDGFPNTRWASQNGPSTDEHYLKLDLGDVRFIDVIIIHWEKAYSRNYEIMVSDDASNWDTVASFQGDNASGGTGVADNLSSSGRYIKILSYEGSPSYGISIYEVEVLGDPNGDCTSGATTCGDFVIEAANAVASSQENSHKGPEKAIDGDFSTRWSSQFQDNEWLALDLGALTRVESVLLYWERAYATSYKLQTGESLNGPWTTVGTIEDSDGELDIVENLDVVTQYMRLLSEERATRYGNSLYEFQVRGSQDPRCIKVSQQSSTIVVCVDGR